MANKIKPVRIDGDVAYITLSRGFEAVIDVTDVPLVEKWNWTVDVRKYTAYAYRTIYNGKHRTGTIVRLHRELLGFPDMDVDHIDTNGLNNRRSNLRVATRSQNLCNRGACETNTSGFKGVKRRKDCNRWTAQIQLNGKYRYIGIFRTAQDAHAAYVAASKELHGEFARAL